MSQGIWTELFHWQLSGYFRFFRKEFLHPSLVLGGAKVSKYKAANPIRRYDIVYLSEIDAANTALQLISVRH